jgi:hypothetical protein
MNTAADLDAALHFASSRVTTEAAAEGQPLTADEKLLLAYLPDSTLTGWAPAHPEGPLVPRNLDLERLCALANTAYANDRQQYSDSLDWEFAFAVFRLNNHPMWGLLQQAGLKHRRALSDGALLILTGLVVVAVLIALVFLTLAVGGKTSERFYLIVFVGGASAVPVASYFAARWLGRKQLQTEIDRCRQSCRFIAP